MFFRRNVPTGRDTLFAHGGEMGHLLQGLDWATTPLGPVSTWPQSLRTAISICLSSGFPMLILWGPEHVQFYNDAFCPILGSKHPQAMGQRGVECWAEIWEVIQPMFADVLAGGEAVNSEDQAFLLDRSGSTEETFFTFSYSPIRDETGNVGGILCTVKETTRQVLSERRVRTLRELAAQTVGVHTTTEACQQALDVLAKSADIPFALLYLLTADGTQAYLMGSAGISDETLAGLHSVDLVGVGENEHAFVQVARTKQLLLLENRYALSSDIPRPQETVLLPIARAGEEDALAGFLLIGIHLYHPFDEEYRGFCELVATQIAAALANARAHEEEHQRAETFEALDRAKTVFFHNISHEFRTPLTLSLGPLEALLVDRDHPLDEEQRTQLEMAHYHVLRQLKLVNTLLDFARIEAGRADATYQLTDLSQLTANLASTFRSAFEQVGLRLLVDCPPLPEPIYVDRDMWEKIVLNLLSNAFKFTFAGTIRVALQMVAGNVELLVQDSGVGIREADVSHLFERFYQAHTLKARTQEGSGIGLALVQELVQLHAGSITVESLEGVGTTFTVRLPSGSSHLSQDRLERTQTPVSPSIGAELYVEEALRWLPADLRSTSELADLVLPSSSPEDQRDEESLSGGSGRVLVVDDNADMRAYLERLLSPTYRVLLAADGISALEMTRETRPDLILSDVMMPGMDGFELLAALRAEYALASIPVILLSARAGEGERLDGLQEGANDYLVKPFSAREVLARVQLWMEIVRLREEAEQATRHLHDLLMQAPAVICVFRGPTHIYELANPGYIRQVGGRELIGKPIREALPELEGQGIFELLDQVYSTGEPFIGNEIRVELGQEPSSLPEEVYFNFIYQPVRMSTGEVEGIMVHAVNVTEQVYSRQRLQTFLGIASHELRNPLTTIKGNVELALRRLKIALLQVPEESKDLREILESIWKMLSRASQQIVFQNRLISDLVDTTRIQAERLELRLAPVDIKMIVREAVEEQRRITPHRTINLELPEKAVPPMLLDADRIGQVVTNYLSNALKYSDVGQDVTVWLERTDRDVRVAVQDRGAGLSTEAQKHIWERFYRVPGVEVQSGTGIGLGLGLYICRTIIAEHGGHVGVESEPGVGSTFWLTLALPSHDL